MENEQGHKAHTFILRFRQVRHPVFVRRLISCRHKPKKSNGQPFDFFCTSLRDCGRRGGTFLCLPPLKAMRGS